jgi:uncharacterized protein
VSHKYLLSIDGGGIRGILPATALVKLEQTTGRLARETFSFAAGTSTGALIASAVAAGLPATRILDIYLKRTREIFSPGPPWNSIKRVCTGSMYSTRNLYNVLAGELGPAARWTLNDSPIDLLLTAKRLADGKPWYFVRDNPRNSQCTGRLGLVDCAAASAAAPTYFLPWTITEPAPPYPACQPVGELVDGGVGVTGNPVYQACVEAFCYTPGYVPSHTTVVSFGTGRLISEQHPHSLLGWLTWVLDETLRSPEEQQTELVARHFTDLTFYRLDPIFGELDPAFYGDIPMDDVASINRLQDYGQRFAARIDWEAILTGRDDTFRVAPQPCIPTSNDNQ